MTDTKEPLCWCLRPGMYRCDDCRRQFCSEHATIHTACRPPRNAYMNMMMDAPMNMGDGTRAGFEATARRMISEQNAEAHAQGWAHDVAGCHLCPAPLREFTIEVEQAERRVSQPQPWWRRLLCVRWG